ncbi:hypothetical protein [Actinomadura sp. BRA 177]|uniref:hypothetical protein n=1 Tax=Actinomadura sp. BRA 177 TaxID=2745202 RepID=UPI0015963636|nr:hypothetical protein [Actinomadura sp. BRA 177]NVI86131.1 hypothetical protein [Actinomadura sp. BRA 177]
MAGVTCGLIPAVALPFVYGWAGGALGAVLQAGLVASLFHGFGTFLLVVTVLQALLAVILFVQHEEGLPRRLAYEWHGRYYVAKDFDARALECVQRAQAAVVTIMDSEVGEAGLLDGIANAVALPRQEWEIARLCAELTHVRRRLREVGSDSRRMREMLEPEWRAAQTSDVGLRRRVVALERYAERTRAADTAYREWQAFEEIQEIRTDLRELLARTVQDDLAVAEIDELSSRTPLAELRRRVADARKAGLTLAMDEKEPV